ncbi:hypothetical protein UK23_37035 [Lentzea aerocolonigenes]|uniref:Uncharacterized protein n=2 Tax=Lentzea aerocolonigenes TaxID=68170 RepID=A0A0F0GJ14_LENAE|nr:hypothetical protein UK23_37035 [Lentzea aerocolonigenes]
MIVRMRAATAAMVGALCGAGWFWSLEPSSQFLCRDSGWTCVISLVLLIVPALVVVWGLVGWGLLRLVRYSPAWPTAVAGTAAAVVLLMIGIFALRFVRVELPEDAGTFLVASAAAGGYALAAVVTGGYRGRRDRTEHSGQDG